MNNKLTIADIASLMAERSGKSKADTEQFLHEFLALAAESLHADKLVRIKGLGTFKIISVDKRESIDVNTGERFIIPAHYKYSYLPDKELKEVVNKPFAFFETTEVNDNISFTDMEESEEEGESFSEDESVEEDIPEIIVVENKELSVIEPEKHETMPEQEETQEERLVVPERNNLPDDEKCKLQETKMMGFVESQSLDVVSKPFYRNEIFIASLVLIAFIAVSITIYKVYNTKPGFITKQTEVNITLPNDLLEPTEEETVLGIDTLDTDTIPVPEKEVANMETERKPEVIKSESKTIGTEKIETGSRLTLLSLKYYGHKIFWVYIYEANKNAIKNPNNVPVGTVVSIPAPELYGIDARDKASISKAATLQSKILSENP